MTLETFTNLPLPEKISTLRDLLNNNIQLEDGSVEELMKAMGMK